MLRSPEPVREGYVRAQYEDDSDAAGYAASYSDGSPASRYFQSRLYAVLEALRRSPGGNLLDVGCGPGLLVSRLLEERPGDFLVHALDMSPAMIRATVSKVGNLDGVRVAVARAEALPFPDQSLDVVVATGVFEYCNLSGALDEVARVTRPGGVVLVTMLNPLSPYRLWEWSIYWPLTRVLGKLERALRIPLERRHGAHRSGIRTVPATRLCRMMRERRLRPDDVVYYDRNLLLPPVDRVVRGRNHRWRQRPETTVASGPRGWIGTAYLVIASRDAEGTAAGRYRGGRRPTVGIRTLRALVPGQKTSHTTNVAE